MRGYPRVWAAIAIAVLMVLLLGLGPMLQEGFIYKGNPCGDRRDCRSCAAAAGCGWCGDLKQCWPMAQDGFPLRVEPEMGPENVPLEIKDFTRQVPVCGPYRFVIEPERC